MDQDSIDRIRSATFTVGRRGYEKREVERFLGRLADWLEHGGDDESRTALVRRELERVGEKTGDILTAAQEAAERLRDEARQESEEVVGEARSEADAVRAAAQRYDSETRSEADAYSERSRVDADTYSSETREEADGYSARTRKEAEVYAAETRERAESESEQLRSDAESEAERLVSEARAEAKRILDEANRKRADVEAVITDLEQRRDGIVGELERLATEVAGTATSHRPGTPPSAESSGGDAETGEASPAPRRAATERS